jgi:hypothetical protein
MGQKGIDLGLGHCGRMPHVAEENEALDPVAVALPGPAAVMAGTEGFAQAVEELRLVPGRYWGGEG